MSLTDILPAPKHRLSTAPSTVAASVSAPPVRTITIPPYGSIERRTFNARSFGDGGSFPEYHRTQYPLDMGAPGHRSTTIATLNVQQDGQVDYSSCITARHRSDQIVHTSLASITPREQDDQSLVRPSEEEEAATTAATRAALETLTGGHIAAGQPRQQATNRSITTSSDPTYVRYTPATNSLTAHQGKPAAESRLIRMQTLPIDPMEPPKFKHVKAPAGPPSPPVPVLHSPPRKVTLADQQQWRIPPCISNWKNIKGYTIAADKRLAADGRGLQEVQINDNFAAFSETLYLAERNARQELATRHELQAKVDMKKKEAREAQLHELALKARAERAGISERHQEAFQDVKQVEEFEEREEVRSDRRRELRRDMRMSHMGTDAKTNKMKRDADRDVSEQIALGKRQHRDAASADGLYDQRLFNRDQGVGRGVHADDAYAAYDRALFESRPTTQYRPGRSEQLDTAASTSTGRFQPDRGFKGADTTKEERHGTGRTKPIQFERGHRDSLQDASRHGDKG